MQIIIRAVIGMWYVMDNNGEELLCGEWILGPIVTHDGIAELIYMTSPSHH